MSHIRTIKNQKGTSYRIYYYRHGKQHTKYLSYKTRPTLRQAKQIALQLELFDNQPVFSNLTLYDLNEIYRKEREKEIEVDRAFFALKTLSDYFGKDYHINAIDHKKFRQFRDDLLRKRLSNYKELDHEREQKTRRGINKELKELRVIFNWAYKHDYLNVKVFDKISFLPVDPAKPVALTKTELKLLRRNLPKSAIRIIFYIGKNTGMRRSEILRMKRKDIDLENRIIHIEKTKNREASKKIIPPELHRIFKWIKITEGNPDELLFHYSKWWITDSFRKAMKKAGIKKRGAFHLLRHTYVTTILRETKNIYLAQKAAGHRNIATTKIYEHLTEEDIKDEISAIKF